MTTRKLTLITMLTAMAIVANIIENSITLPLVFPGVKLGLANVFAVIALYMFGAKEMLLVNIMRVLLASLLSGRIFSYTFFMSLAGALLSSLVVILFKRRSGLSIIGINCISAAFHGVGQILIVMIVMKSTEIVMYLGVMILLAIPTGLFTGFLSKMIFERIRKENYNA